MPSIAYLTAALAFTSAVVATPVQLEKRGAFTIHQVERSTFLKNGPAQKVKTLRKFGKPVPAALLAAAEARVTSAEVFAAAAGTASGTDAANPSDDYDSSYLSPVTVGSTTVQLDFDTGSSDL